MSDYPSDLTDGQWQLIRPLLPKPAKRGRAPIDRRAILDAILYVVRTGCQCRQLPIDFPNWKTIYTVFWRWRKAGLWRQIHDTLRRRVRQAVGKKRTPTAAIIDSQSVCSAEAAKNVVTTRAKGTPVASGTWRSIRSGWCGWSSCMVRSGKITMEPV